MPLTLFILHFVPFCFAHIKNAQSLFWFSLLHSNSWMAFCFADKTTETLGIEKFCQGHKTYKYHGSLTSI